MRTLLLLLASATPLAAQTAPPDFHEILTQENLFWTAYTTGSTDALDKLLAPEFTNVEQEIWRREQVLSFIKVFFKQCNLAPVTVLDPKVTYITPNIATIVYHATESPTCGTRTISGETNISTVWARKDSQAKWQMSLHTEYAIPPK